MATPPTFWMETGLLYMLHWYHKVEFTAVEENNQGSQNETLNPVLFTIFF